MSVPTIIQRSGSLGGSTHFPYFRKPACALGVLMTGYVEKLDPDAYLPKRRHRFLVATHQSLHWFKREKGVDLFGEERGSAALADIKETDYYKGDDKSFYILLEGGDRRVFYVSTQEEATKWLHCIQTAIRSRYLYRRETLSGLSFIHTVEGEGDGITRPRILFLTRSRNISEDGKEARGKEVVLCRHVEYEKRLPLPPLQGDDELTLTLVSGACVTAKGSDVLAHVEGAGEDAERKKLKLCFRGGSGGAVVGAELVLDITAVEDSLPVAGREGKGEEEKDAGSYLGVLYALADEVFRVEHGIPLLCATFLVLVVLTEEGRVLSLSERMLDRRTAAMIFVAGGLILHVLISLFGEESEASEDPAALATPMEGGGRRGIFLEVVDYLPAKPVIAMGGEETEGKGSRNGRVGTPGSVMGRGAADEEERPLPQRFIDGCLGDMTEAMRRWNLTCEWRREYGTDGILDEPQPYFDLIKQCYPSWYCGEGINGDPVYWERSGQVDQPRMRVAGCGIDELLRHYVMVTEFCWVKLYPDETKKTITVFSVEGVGIRDLAGEAFDFLRRSIHLISEHYPERSAVIMITNAPSWFAVLWKIIRPMVNERTQKKVKIVSKKETLECLKEFIPEENIPVEYGGKLRFGDGVDTARWKSPQEVALREHVLAVNKKHGVEMVVDDKMKEAQEKAKG